VRGAQRARSTLAIVLHVLITGMSGAGKSTVLSELARRGRRTIDTDYDDWVRADGTWDETRMTTLLSSIEPVIVSGTVENQGRFYDRFAEVVLLSAPIDILLHRLEVRTNNPYGRSPTDRDEVRRHIEQVEPLLRATATVELDGRLPVVELADRIEQLLPDRDPRDA
jgi:shikimate kinase